MLYVYDEIEINIDKITKKEVPILQPGGVVIAKKQELGSTVGEIITSVYDILEQGVQLYIENVGEIKTVEDNLIIKADTIIGMKVIACIKEKLDKLGRPKKYTRNKVNEILEELRVNGGILTYTDLANKHNISKSTLVKWQRLNKTTGEGRRGIQI